MKRVGRGLRPQTRLSPRSTFLRKARFMTASHSTTPSVTFKTVADFPNHMVGDDGSVWELTEDRWVRIQPRIGTTGYLSVNLRWGGSKRNVAVHRLVLETFVGPCPPGMECRHVPDFDPANNRLDNLQWGTPKENQNDKRIHGFRRHEKGKSRRRKHLNSIIPPKPKPTPPPSKERFMFEAEMRVVRKEFLHGIAPEIIAESRGISVNRVLRIINPAIPDDSDALEAPE